MRYPSFIVTQVFVCGAWEALGLLHSCADQFYPTQISSLACRFVKTTGATAIDKTVLHAFLRDFETTGANAKRHHDAPCSLPQE